MYVNFGDVLPNMFARKQTHTHTSVYTPHHTRPPTHKFKLHVLLSTCQDVLYHNATSLQQYPADASCNDTHVPASIRPDDSRGKRQFVDTLRPRHNVDVIGAREIRSDDVCFDRHHFVCWVVDVQLKCDLSLAQEKVAT